MKTVNQAARMGHSLKFSSLFCMKTFSTSVTNYRHRYSSHQNLSKTRSRADRIIHI